MPAFLLLRLTQEGHGQMKMCYARSEKVLFYFVLFFVVVVVLEKE